jgi:transposase
MSAIRCFGVDVSKAKLDVAVRKRGGGFTHRSFENTRKGVASFQRMIGKRAALVVVEATGAYSSLIHEVLTERGFAVAVVNPTHVRSLAKAHARHAKTDIIDAELLVEFGEAVKPAATPLQSVEIRELRACMQRRKQLSELLTAQRNQREAASALVDEKTFDDVEKVLLEKLRDLEKRVVELSKSDGLSPIIEKLCEQCGVGAVVAATVVSELPEVGRIDDKVSAALAGLVPYAHQSGTMHARGHIRGGRRQLRSTLYMAALVAVQHDPRLKAFYERLIQSGKPKKLALLAATRKLLTWLNARVRELLKKKPALALG